MDVFRNNGSGSHMESGRSLQGCAMGSTKFQYNVFALVSPEVQESRNWTLGFKKIRVGLLLETRKNV